MQAYAWLLGLFWDGFFTARIKYGFDENHDLERSCVASLRAAFFLPDFETLAIKDSIKIN